MSTNALIAVKEGDCYRGIYCHFDGYPTGVGKTLRKFYLDPEKVKKLIDLGDVSNLGRELGTKHDFEKCPPGECNFYGRDREEPATKAQFYHSIDAMIRVKWASYVYVFEDGWWSTYRKV